MIAMQSKGAHRLSRADILPLDEYARIRGQSRREISELKKRRRVEVGPFATFYLENFATMWSQVHEMLYIEKGGEEQIADELAAYNPLIPQGSELTATVMFEIDDPARRVRTLTQLGGIEHRAFVEVAGVHIRGEPDPTRKNTSPGGKASSVQFIRFPFTPGTDCRVQGAGGTHPRRFRPPQLSAHGAAPRPRPRRPRRGFRLDPRCRDRATWRSP